MKVGHIVLTVIASLFIWISLFVLPKYFGRQKNTSIVQVEQTSFNTTVFHLQTIKSGIITTEEVIVPNERLNTYYGKIGYDDYAQNNIFNELLVCNCPIAGSIFLCLFLFIGITVIILGCDLDSMNQIVIKPEKLIYYWNQFWELGPCVMDKTGSK